MQNGGIYRKGLLIDQYQCMMEGGSTTISDERRNMVFELQYHPGKNRTNRFNKAFQPTSAHERCHLACQAWCPGEAGQSGPAPPAQLPLPAADPAGSAVDEPPWLPTHTTQFSFPAARLQNSRITREKSWRTFSNLQAEFFSKYQDETIMYPNSFSNKFNTANRKNSNSTPNPGTYLK
jgi:hypothetical protein